MYTDDDRAAALAALASNGGNLRKTARQTGHDTKTLRRWRDMGENAPHKKAVDARLPEAKANLADRFEAFVHAALDIAPDKLPEAGLADVFRAVGISIDKLRLLKGEATDISEVRTSDAKRELAERIARLAGRPGESPGPPN